MRISSAAMICLLSTVFEKDRGKKEREMGGLGKREGGGQRNGEGAGKVNWSEKWGKRKELE